VRTLARHLASEGRTVFLSSHLMSEMAQTADQIIVLGRGKIIADAPVGDIIALAAGNSVRVRTPDADRFANLLAGKDVTISKPDADVLVVNGLKAAHIGEIAAGSRIVLHELTPLAGSLEDAYLALTEDDVEYHAADLVGAAAPVPATTTETIQ
jgi:ABC-2 type transport system ATP-binding protein